MVAIGSTYSLAFLQQLATESLGGLQMFNYGKHRVLTVRVVHLAEFGVLAIRHSPIHNSTCVWQS